MPFEKLGKYFVGRSVPESYFPEASKSEKILMPWLTIIATIGFIFLVVFKYAMVGAGEYFDYISLALIYIPIGIIAFNFNLTELTEKKTLWGDSSTLTGSYSFWQVLLIGLGIGALFIYPQLLGSIAGLQIFSIKTLAAGTFGSLLITGILIPIIENSFFAKFLVPSMFELGGRFDMAGPTGIVVPSVIFGLIHAGAYGVLGVTSPLAFFSALAFPIIFRMITSTAILETRSYLVAFLPHILINSTLVLMA